MSSMSKECTSPLPETTRNFGSTVTVHRGQPPGGRKPGRNRVFAPKPRPSPASARLSHQTRPQSARNRRHNHLTQRRHATAPGVVRPTPRTPAKCRPSASAHHPRTSALRNAVTQRPRARSVPLIDYVPIPEGA
jgi:hypothetical protein